MVLPPFFNLAGPDLVILALIALLGAPFVITIVQVYRARRRPPASQPPPLPKQRE